MKILHRKDTSERQHYLIDKKNTYTINPKILYVGEVKRKKDWREDSHSHSFVEILLIKSGCGSVFINGTAFEVQRGDIVIYNADDEHYEISSQADPFSFSFVACDNIQIASLPSNHIVHDGQSPIIHTKNMEGYFRILFSMLLSEMTRKDLYYDELAENMLKSLVALIFRLIDKGRSMQSATKKNALYNSVLHYIDDHFTEKLTLDDIAMATYSSKYNICHIFTQYNGNSIFEYINEKRLNFATELLKTTELPVKSIAEKSGFSDVNYFCRYYKSQRGCTPSSQRKNKSRPENLR